MRDILINPTINKSMIISMEEYDKIPSKHEILLYGDNVLEGITLLNILTESNDVLRLHQVVYEPIDQPIYIFKDDEDHAYAIKICGAYDKWHLPQKVGEMVHFIDLPDYVFYSIEKQDVLIAGENTETASVGNSQWQREGRKIGAARVGVPFIYQTFYSGKDESQDTIREPNSLQVYNQILYSIRYKVASFVAYFENNFQGAATRIRTPKDSEILFGKYIKSVIVDELNPSVANRAVRRNLEVDFFEHMLSYLKEGKYSGSKGLLKTPRIDEDFPIINSSFRNAIVTKTRQLSEDIVRYIYGEYPSFLTTYPVDSINKNKLTSWSGYTNKPYIEDMISYLTRLYKSPKSYISGQSKVGLAETESCRKYLTAKFSANATEINRILDPTKYPETVLMPLRIHKKSNGALTFSPDPESGEIVAFGELFGFDSSRQKKRPVVGYVIVDTPVGFDFKSKKDSKLYNALAQYVDILIFDDKDVVTNFPRTPFLSDYKPTTNKNVHPISLSEEMAVVSTYLNQSQINSDWKLCFIHTHHSSWQQLVVHTTHGEKQHKIDRVSTKVDLIMQGELEKQAIFNLFMVAEGKNNFLDLIRDQKIHKAMKDAGELLDTLYKATNKKFDAFIYNLDTVPSKDPAYYVSREVDTIKGAISRGHFDDIAYEKDYVLIVVYKNAKNKTEFKLVYSPGFDTAIRKKLDKEFYQ